MSNTERETLDVDVLFVGAGPASLAGACHLGNLIERHNETADRPLEVMIAVLEKGKEIGSHAISGAVVDPRALRELFPRDWRDAPFEGAVEDEKLLWLTERRALSMPIPPMMENDGKYVASLGKLTKWMAAKAEEVGVDVFCEFPGSEVLLEGDQVVGVRTGDRGIGHDGQQKANYEPGVDILSRVTVLGEGPRGTLSEQLNKRLALDAEANPQVYAIGIKEVWELPSGRVEPGQVAHTMGWPLDRHTFEGCVDQDLPGLVAVELKIGVPSRKRQQGLEPLRGLGHEADEAVDQLGDKWFGPFGRGRPHLGDPRIDDAGGTRRSQDVGCREVVKNQGS